MKTKLTTYSTMTLVWMSVQKRYASQLDIIMDEISERISFEEYEAMISKQRVNEMINA